jgi:hypothetical protein
MSWVVGVGALVLVAFGAGLVLSSKSISIRIDADDGAAEQRPADGAGQAKQPSAGERGRDPSGQAPASAGDGPAAAASTASAAADADDGSELPASQGYLLVRSSDEKLHVYQGRTDLGATDERLVVACGMTQVRLGDAPLEHWYSDQRSVEVGCQTVTMITITASAASPLIPQSPSVAQASPPSGVPQPSKPPAATSPPRPQPPPGSGAKPPPPTAAPKEYWIPPSL